MLTAEKIAYFKSLEAILNSQEDLSEFLENVFREIDGHEVQLSLHKVTSTVLEKIIEKCSIFHIRVFVDRISGQVDRLAFHRSGSHVLEKTFKRMLDEGAGNEQDNDENKDLRNIQKLLQDSLEELDVQQLLGDQYGSHIFRIIIDNLCANEELKQSLESVINRISQIKNIWQLGLSVHSSCSLQKLMNCLHKNNHIELFNKIFKNVLDLESNAPINLLSDKQSLVNADILITNKNGSHFMQVILETISDEDFVFLFENLLQKKLAKYVSHDCANFVVQQFLDRCNKEQLEIFLKTENVISDVTKATNIGVLIKCADACIRIEALYKKFMEVLKKSVNVEDSLLLKSLLFLSSQSFKPQGAVLLDKLFMFPFEHVSMLSNSILDMDENNIFQWSTDKVACHVIESFLKGTAPNKMKKKLSHTLIGKALELALDQYGSYILESVWSAAEVNVKKTLAESLVKNLGKLEGNFYGKKVVNNLNLRSFGEEDWLKRQEQQQLKKRVFADLLGGSSREEYLKQRSKAKKKAKKQKST
ncbi:ARM repeat-containing protein [Rozella allomycis CSF55]|uniref:Nucleolar protein 9 n=1 Tax=Rozella allomycis (strain CSF55) TaxID=988480 RepID=A0A075APA4_ROZAC|nr:Pumilio domain-containing and C14ORF21-like protein [Rozella allomycis CSF55]RKP19080.1 ARM repeat-containing protein [Rozella allomycis CSF55]|eukprot:EPZ31828.1 Pumilio domain-containing and C14ORF21-like protein [Rozella allomycis CSF55]